MFKIIKKMQKVSFNRAGHVDGRGSATWTRDGLRGRQEVTRGPDIYLSLYNIYSMWVPRV